MKKIVDYKNEIIKNLSDDVFVFFVKDRYSYTYHVLFEKAIVLANYFERESIKSVLPILENGSSLFLLYFATMLANVTIIPIDPHKSDEEIQLIISENNTAFKIEDEHFFDVFSVDEHTSMDGIIERISNIDYEKVYCITYTSGSEGYPKGVRHSLGNLMAAGLSFGKKVGLTKQNTMCHVMPMTYMAGILNTIIMPLVCGSRVVVMPRFDVMSAINFWQTVEDYKVDAFWLSPSMLSILMTIDRKGKAADYLSGINPLFFIGTAPLYEEVRTKFEEKYNVKLLQSYGLSETLFVSTQTCSCADNGNVGELLPEVKLSIEEDSELKIEVPWMFMGYTNVDTDRYFDGNTYCSGDLGTIVDDKLVITGRKKDLIIKGGMNISPRQIEECILRTSCVEDCAVAGVTIEGEERIICWYVGDNIPEEMDSTVNNIIAKEVGKHCKVDVWVKRKEIPKNLNGKNDKKTLVGEFCHDSKI